MRPQGATLQPQVRARMSASVPQQQQEFAGAVERASVSGDRDKTGHARAEIDSRATGDTRGERSRGRCDQRNARPQHVDRQRVCIVQLRVQEHVGERGSG